MFVRKMSCDGPWEAFCFFFTGTRCRMQISTVRISLTADIINRGYHYLQISLGTDIIG